MKTNKLKNLIEQKESLQKEWSKIVKDYDDIENKITKLEYKENYDKTHLAEIKKKYTGKIIMPNGPTNFPQNLYSVTFYVVEKIVPESIEKFNIVGKYISVRNDGCITNVSMGTKKLYPYLGLQSYKFEKETGFTIVTAEEMVNTIKKFKQIISQQFNNSINELSLEYNLSQKKSKVHK